MAREEDSECVCTCMSLFFRFAFAGVCLHVLEGHIGIVRCLELKRWRLVSGGDRKRIIVWNVKVNAGTDPGGWGGGRGEGGHRASLLSILEKFSTLDFIRVL